jgi:aromatic ring-opening dioxygenase catalytic subunit (LigB family)
MPDGPFGGREVWGALRDYLEAMPGTVPTPRAILCVTAHWEAPVVTVSSAAQPGMLYDYGGFPPHTYEVVWPAPGSPELAGRVCELLSEAGVPSNADPARGFDHGTFVPLAVAWPQAEVPTVQLSLVRGLDPATHLTIGRALAPLRDEGVLIVGSGMSYHDLRGYRTEAGRQHADRFDAWLQHAVTQGREERDDALWAWSRAPSARQAHPREEHLLPLMVVAGAAGDDVGTVPFSEQVLGTRVSAVRFG